MPSNQGGDNFVFIVGKDGKKLPVLTGPADQAVFAVTITGSNLPISPGDTLDIDYSVENTGGVQDTQDIRLDIDGSREDRDSDVTIAAGNTSTGTLSYSTSGSDDRLRAIVWSDDTQDSLDVSLNANYTVTIDSTNSPVVEGNDLDVTATIKNTGSEPGNQDITLETGSTVRDTFSSLSLGGSESKQITLTWATSDGDLGDYTATVSSQDNSDSENTSIGTILETFNDGDISEYSGDTGQFEAQTGTVRNGSHALKATDGNYKYIKSDTSFDTPSQGDKWEFYMRYDDSANVGHHFFNVGGSEAYGVGIDAGAGNIDIIKMNDISTNSRNDMVNKDITASNYTNQWLRCVVWWYTDNTLEFEVKGVAGPISTSSASDTGGDKIGFSINNRDGQANSNYYDELLYLNRSLGTP